VRKNPSNLHHDNIFEKGNSLASLKRWNRWGPRRGTASARLFIKNRKLEIHAEFVTGKEITSENEYRKMDGKG